MDFIEDNAFISQSRTDSYPSTRLTNYALITSFDTFNQLTFWNKIDFINSTSDQNLLRDISEKVDSRQLKALTLHRLQKLTE